MTRDSARPQQRVAQKLGYANWHLQWMARHTEPGQAEALLESAILHGVGAYRAFLTEIAQDEHLRADVARTDVSSAGQLRGAYGDYLPPALAECVNLEAQPGWLSDLLSWSRSLEVGAAVGRPEPTGLLIATAADCPTATRAVVARTLQELESLIERLRGDMLEY